MIIRSITLRHGRIALARPPIPLRTWRRTVTTEAETTERPVQDPFAEEQRPRMIVQSPPVNAAGARFEIRDPHHPVARDLIFKHHLRTITDHLGNTVDPDAYKPHELISNPPWPSDITLELLMASQAHLGHSTALWHPANARYIFGIRGTDDPIHIISLDATATYLRRACRIVQGVAEKGGIILFVGTRPGQARAVVKAAKLSKGCHLFTKWVPGTITNGQQILGRCAKKVVDPFDQEVPGFEPQLYDQAVVKPDLVVCLNPLDNYVLLKECGLNNIPTIGVVDTDCNPTWVTYPVPANDDSLRCISVIAGVLGRAGQIGQRIRVEKTKKGFYPTHMRHTLEPPRRLLRSGANAAPAEEVKDEREESAELDGVEEVELGSPSFLPREELAALSPIDYSLVDEEADVQQEETFEPYEIDRPLGVSVDEAQASSEQIEEGSYPEETAEEAGLRQRLEEAVRQQEQEDRKP